MCWVKAAINQATIGISIHPAMEIFMFHVKHNLHYNTAQCFNIYVMKFDVPTLAHSLFKTRQVDIGIRHVIYVQIA